MMNLLLLEWYKLRYNRLFWVVGVLYIVGLPLLFSVGKSLEITGAAASLTGSFYSFPNVWSSLGYLGSWLTFFFFGFLGIYMVSEEFVYKTVRQNVISGLSRTEFLLSKWYAIMVISLFAALYYGVVGLLFGLLNSEAPSMAAITARIDLVPRFFLQTMGYMVFGAVLTIWLRRSALALVSYFLYSAIIEETLRHGIHKRILGEVNSVNYYPINVWGDLVPMPAPPEFATAVSPNFDYFVTMPTVLVLAVLYIGLFLGIGYYLFQKKDI